MLFGGSFDPPHTGHTSVVSHVLVAGLADQVWYVPCGQHAFNKPLSPAEHRLAMLQTVLVPNTLMYKHEIDQPTTSYAIDTLKFATQTMKDYTFSWLIGADQLASFHKWKEYQELLKGFTVFVHPRRGFAFEPLYPGMQPLYQLPSVDVSSTAVRDMVSKNQDIAQVVSPSVAAYIKEKQLYDSAV